MVCLLMVRDKAKVIVMLSALTRPRVVVGSTTHVVCLVCSYWSLKATRAFARAACSSGLGISGVLSARYQSVCGDW